MPKKPDPKPAEPSNPEGPSEQDAMRQAVKAVTFVEYVEEALSPATELLSASGKDLKQLGQDALAAKNLASMALDAVPQEKLQGTIITSIRYCMATLHMTQAELSRRSGLSTVVINRLLKGKRRITLDQLTAISKALGVYATALLDGSFMASPEQMERLSRLELPSGDLPEQAVPRLQDLPDQLRGPPPKPSSLSDVHMPEFLQVFLREYSQKITHEEKVVLAAVGASIYPQEVDEEYWFGFIRMLRKTSPWPPPPKKT